MPKVSVDYCFLKAEEGDAVTRTVLVLHARPSKAVAATCVQGKGREDPHAVPWLVGQLRRLGLGRCVLQADGEPVQRVFIKDVIEAAAATSNLGIAAAHSPAYDHKANGAVERAIREVKGVVRSLYHGLQERVGQISPTEGAFDWLVEWSGEVITGLGTSKDGMTAYRRLRGDSGTPSWWSSASR